MSLSTNNSNWGRSNSPSISSLLVVYGTLLFAPLLGYFFLPCSVVSFSIETTLWTLVWILFQYILAQLPNIITFFGYYQGGKQEGQLTPAGNKIVYNINGLQSLLISINCFVYGIYFGFFKTTVIANHWGELFVTVNIIGYLLATFAYLKARLCPDHLDDCKKTTSVIYNYFFGIEFNPSIGNTDLKLFFNGRPGIIAWILINLSFTGLFYERHQTLSNSIILINILQALYVFDFFWNEKWYIKTIDIAHDHFGWYLAWGDCVWLPFMYTLQIQHLATTDIPFEINNYEFIIILIFGLLGYILFRWTNYQKDLFRSDEHCLIWGKPPKIIECRYHTKDNNIHKTRLLCSGFWGVARHLNYTGDLILSLCYSLPTGLPTGFQNIRPYFYFIYMVILLTMRCFRDEHRCEAKYSEQWKVYCKQVKYRFIPYVF